MENKKIVYIEDDDNNQSNESYSEIILNSFIFKIQSKYNISEKSDNVNYFI